MIRITLYLFLLTPAVNSALGFSSHVSSGGMERSDHSQDDQTTDESIALEIKQTDLFFDSFSVEFRGQEGQKRKEEEIVHSSVSLHQIFLLILLLSLSGCKYLFIYSFSINPQSFYFIIFAVL